MADAQRTVDIIFNGVDKTAAAVQSAIKNTGGFAQGIQTATQPVADFTASALKFEAAILTAGAAITSFAINEAASFESALADLNKVLSDTDNIEEYANLATELSNKYGVASTEVVQAIANYKQAGFTAEEAGILTKAGLDLVIAGGVEASRASDLLVASLKGFGAEASSTSGFVDLLNSVSNEYAVSVDQLLEGFSTFSPIARSAGLSLQETVGILTPGIEVFRSGSEVANALRTSFLRLQDDSKPVQEALEAIGVAQRDANGDLRSARDIFFDVADALGGVDENQRAYIASQLVGIQRSSQFLAVTDGLDKSLRIAGDGFQFLGSAAKEVEIQLNTASNAANRVKENFSNLLIDLGTPLLDEFSSLGNAISDIFRAIGDSAETGGLGDLNDYIEDALGGLAASAEEVAQNLPAALAQADFSGFINGLEEIEKAFDVVFGGIDLTTVDGLARGIELIGAGFEGLSRFTAGVITSFEPLVNALRDLADGSTEVGDGFNQLGESFGFVLQINKLSGAITAVIPVLQGFAALFAVNQAGNLLGGLNAFGKSMSGKTGIIANLGKLAALGAAGSAGFGLGTLANEVTRLTTGESLSRERLI